MCLCLIVLCCVLEESRSLLELYICIAEHVALNDFAIAERVGFDNRFVAEDIAANGFAITEPVSYSLCLITEHIATISDAITEAVLGYDCRTE